MIDCAWWMLELFSITITSETAANRIGPSLCAVKIIFMSFKMPVDEFMTLTNGRVEHMHSSNKDHSNNTVGKIISFTSRIRSVAVTWAISGRSRILSTSGVVCTDYLLSIGNSAVNQGDWWMVKKIISTCKMQCISLSHHVPYAHWLAEASSASNLSKASSSRVRSRLFHSCDIIS